MLYATTRKSPPAVQAAIFVRRGRPMRLSLVVVIEQE
jgi:hypothetical protein